MGSRSSKRNSIGGEPLSKESIAELCQDTGFSEDELLQWHTNFYKDCPDGKLTLKQFEHEYAKIMGKPTQKTADYVKHMFSVYDHDKNQFIDFKEFVMALSAASVVNRLRLVETLFHVFDLDNDGKITKEEIAKMLHTLVDVTNSNQKRRRQNHPDQQEQTKQIILQKRIDDAFNELNANDDDHITKDEFIEWYMKSGLISDVQSDEINVPDASRLQQFGKKSRKFRKQFTQAKSSNEEQVNANQGPRLARHLSRMTERKPTSNYDHDNNDNLTTNSTFNDNEQEDYDIDVARSLNKPVIRVTTNADDNDSNSSKENERWQHLFNSVLGQIRAQRLRDQQQQQQQNVTTTTDASNFKSWKQEGANKIRFEYTRQKSNGEQQQRSNVSTKTVVPTSPVIISDDEVSSSDDIVTVRF